MKSLNSFNSTSTTIHWASITCQPLGRLWGYKWSMNIQDACLPLSTCFLRRRKMQLQRVIWQATQIPTSAPRCSFLPVSGSHLHPSLGIALGWSQVCGPRLCLPIYRQPTSSDSSIQSYRSLSPPSHFRITLKGHPSSEAANSPLLLPSFPYRCFWEHTPVNFQHSNLPSSICFLGKLT